MIDKTHPADYLTAIGATFTQINNMQAETV